MSKPIVTEILAVAVVVECPKCEKQVSGFLVDPRGHDFECEHCDKPFAVHLDADVELRM